MATKKITVKIVGDASDFRKTIKDTQSMQGKLGKLTQKMQKSGLGQHKDLQKITKTFNKGQRSAAKEALSMEKKLQKEMKNQINIIKTKQKAHKHTADAIKDEVRALKGLEKEYKKVHKFRQQTGYKTMGERAKGRLGGMASKGLGMLGSAAMTGIAGLLAGAVAGAISQVSSGYGAYVGYGRQAAGLAGTGVNAMKHLKTLSNGTQELDPAAFYWSRKLGFSATETLGHVGDIARQTGSQGDPMRRARMAQAYSRSYGGTTGETIGMMGTMTRAAGGFGATQRRQFGVVMSQAFRSGMDKSRSGEAMQAIGQGIQAAASRTAGAVNGGEIAGLLSWLGRSGTPGLQGARGMATLSAMDAGFRSAGQISMSGDAQKALAFQSMGFGLPGGDTATYTEALDRIQQGFLGAGGAENLLDFTSRLRAGGRDDTETSLLMNAAAPGTTRVQMQGVLDRIDQGGSREEILAAIEASMESAKPIQEQIKDAIEDGNLAVAARDAKLQDRLVGIGATLAEPLEQMQDALNAIMIKFLPAIKLLLEGMATAIEFIKRGIDALADFFVESWHASVEFLNSSEESINDFFGRDAHRRVAFGDANLTAGQAPTVTSEERAAALSSSAFGQAIGASSGLTAEGIAGIEAQQSEQLAARETVALRTPIDQALRNIMLDELIRERNLPEVSQYERDAILAESNTARGYGTVTDAAQLRAAVAQAVDTTQARGRVGNE